MLLRKFLLLIVALLIGNHMPSHAQTDGSFQSRFLAFKKQKVQDFQTFRKRINEQFAECLAQPWKVSPTVAPVPLPKHEEVKPEEVPIEKVPPVGISTPTPFKAKVTPPAPAPQPQPIIPLREITVPPVQQDAAQVAFTYFGTKDAVRFDTSHIFHLADTKEKEVAKAWRTMSGEEYCAMLSDCLAIREKRQLCDWAYINMLEAVAVAVCGKGTNEAVMLQAFLFAQSGYAMRLGRDVRQGNLHLFYGTEHMIYGTWSYQGERGTESKVRYYKYGEPLDVSDRVEFENVEFPQEKVLSLYVTTEQLLDDDSDYSPIVHESKHVKNLRTEVTPNRNLLQFYSTYPTSFVSGDMMTRWAMYAETPISSSVRRQLYPVLKEAIEGCSQVEAVNKLLDYIQTGYEYGYDNDVWGDDRAFFPDETLFYPFCDCEDRAILLTRLVRDLLGLRCLLVYYPGHLACAIEFDESSEAKGDYFMVDGHRFTSADPTYIVSRAGQTANAKQKDQAVVIVLK